MFYETRGEAYLLLTDYKTAVSNFKRALQVVVRTHLMNDDSIYYEPFFPENQILISFAQSILRSDAKHPTYWTRKDFRACRYLVDPTISFLPLRL